VIGNGTNGFTGGDGLRDYDVGLPTGEISIGEVQGHIGTARSCP
jgi:hypothetical protein